MNDPRLLDLVRACIAYGDGNCVELYDKPVQAEIVADLGGRTEYPEPVTTTIRTSEKIIDILNMASDAWVLPSLQRWLNRQIGRAGSFVPEESRLFSIAADPYGLPVGALETAPHILLRYTGEGSLITIAPPGKGKTQCHVLPTLASYLGPVIALDVKGECFEATAAIRKRRLWQHIIRFAPTEPDDSACYNPLAFVDARPDELWESARFLADLMVVVRSQSDPMWETMGKDLLTLFIAHTVHSFPEEERTLQKVLDLVSTVGLAEMLADVSSADSPYPTAMRRTAARFQQMSVNSPKQFEGVLTGAGQYVQVWEGPKIERITQSCDWGPEDFRRDPSPTLYLCIPPEAIDTYAPILRVVIGQHVRHLMRDHGRKGPPILFMLDELPRLGQMQPIREALETGRSYGIKLWMFAQYPEQITTAYPGVGEGMIKACDAALYMNPSMETAEHISKAFGESINVFGGVRKNIIDPTDIMSPEHRDSVFVLASGEEPAILKKSFFYNNNPDRFDQDETPENPPEEPPVPDEKPPTADSIPATALEQPSDPLPAAGEAPASVSAPDALPVPPVEQAPVSSDTGSAPPPEQPAAVPAAEPAPAKPDPALEKLRATVEVAIAPASPATAVPAPSAPPRPAAPAESARRPPEQGISQTLAEAAMANVRAAVVLGKALDMARDEQNAPTGWQYLVLWARKNPRALKVIAGLVALGLVGLGIQSKLANDAELKAKQDAVIERDIQQRREREQIEKQRAQLAEAQARLQQEQRALQETRAREAPRPAAPAPQRQPQTSPPPPGYAFDEIARLRPDVQLGPPPVSAPPAPARPAPQADEITLCDRLAANPADLNRHPGVTGTHYPDLAANAQAAVEACAAAVAANRTPRRRYQLARAYQSFRPDQALALYGELVQRDRYPAAFDNLGSMYLIGSGVPQNPQQAAMYFRSGVAHGDPASMLSLARMILVGQAPALNSYEQPMNLIMRAAQSGNPLALTMRAKVEQEVARNPELQRNPQLMFNFLRDLMLKL